MLDRSHQKMQYVLQSLEKDPEYLWLLSCRDGLEDHVALICKDLSREDREILLEYRGISQEMMLRMVEIACFLDEL